MTNHIILGIGTDLIRLSRFTKIIQKNGLSSNYISKFSKRILNEKFELIKFDNFKQKNDINMCSKILTSSWSSKEALFKTLDLKDQKLFNFNQWYKINDINGKPIINNLDYIQSYPNEQFLLTLSDDGDYLTSIVLRIKKV
ncbi:uncharacterized protein ASCRUDRAFT_98925 [Ascoidea rubescens DSM 1968]|uniref:4'-phosphopantetheinyl transferase domain-containing protein n=1 Tax=Ascoidea rubescens DSM 1968 TaxID=1344418 RepID=A0A1D2VQC0_9ASCO|nr:hypothetical protein ASCRUDRAFT_98925 [Ascoidea rubescens DSM 1968]ODV63799.1 hypothetical protein ASCRUDRAFT_98925 [Ascoidea rubescens DSM 1968]